MKLRLYWAYCHLTNERGKFVKVKDCRAGIMKWRHYSLVNGANKH